MAEGVKRDAEGCGSLGWEQLVGERNPLLPRVHSKVPTYILHYMKYLVPHAENTKPNILSIEVISILVKEAAIKCLPQNHMYMVYGGTRN